MNQKKQKMKPKTKQLIQTFVRIVIQTAFFIFLPSAFSSAFAGIKYLFSQLGIKESVGFVSFLQILLLLVVFTIVFGRFFCGFACAFGSVGDWLHLLYVWICKKAKKKPVTLGYGITRYLSYLKYVILLAIVVCCYAGVYSNYGKWNPWTVFSLLRVGNYHLRDYVPGIVLLGLILVGMTLIERFFCRFLCPMGAVFSLLPALPFFSIRRSRKDCLNGCTRCLKTCPSDINLPDKYDWNVAGDCFQCQQCISACPKQNVKGTRFRLKGNEIWLTLCRALLLAGLLVLTGLG